MSLLMDALKQAEQGRDQGSKTAEPQLPDPAPEAPEPAVPAEPTAQAEPTPAQAHDLSLEPADPAVPREDRLDAPPAADMPPPEGPIEDDDGGVTPTPPAQEQVEAVPAPAPPDGVEPEPAEAPDSARAARILAAKRNRDRRRQRRWIMGGGLGLSAMVVAVTVYGFLLQSDAPAEMMLGMSEPIAPVAEIASENAAATDAPVAAGDGAQTPAAPTRPAAGSAVTAAPDEPDRSGGGSAAVVPASRASRASQPAVSAPYSPDAGEAATAGGPPPSIRIRRTQHAAELNTELQTAYRAYRGGDYAAAGRVYARILADHPRQRDALLGRAAVALQQGDRDTALRHYDTLLRLDPTDAAAHAALAGLRSESPRALESRLQELLDTRPRAAHLHFALGNLYADQQRWAEAQRAYFQAHRHAPDNADYACNLAVALDRLDQGGAALEYYRKALALSGTQAVQFDPQRLKARVATLAGRQAEDPA